MSFFCLKIRLGFNDKIRDEEKLLYFKINDYSIEIEIRFLSKKSIIFSFCKNVFYLKSRKNTNFKIEINFSWCDVETDDREEALKTPFDLRYD